MSHAKKYFINPNSNNVTIPKDGGGSVTVVPFAIRERVIGTSELWYVEGDYYEQYVTVGRSLAPLDPATARKYIKESKESEIASHDGPSPADDTPAGMGAPHPSAESDASMLHRTVIANEHNRRVADGQNPPGADADVDDDDESGDDADEIIEDDDLEVEKPAKPMTAMEKLKAKTASARVRAKNRADKLKDGK